MFIVQLILSSQIYFVLHADSRAARSGTTRITPGKSYSKRVLGLLVGTSRKKYARHARAEGKIISSCHVPPVWPDPIIGRRTAYLIWQIRAKTLCDCGG
jgi:hypothetical protein